MVMFLLYPLGMGPRLSVEKNKKTFYQKMLRLAGIGKLNLSQNCASVDVDF